MNYLELLKKEKLNREEYQRDAEKLKYLINDINTQHSVNNGQFLESLERFLKNYKPNL